MSNNNVETLKLIFSQVGIFISDDEMAEELLLDSIQFITLILAIEKEFSIKIDDNYLGNDTLKTFQDFIKLLPENQA